MKQSESLFDESCDGLAQVQQPLEQKILNMVCALIWFWAIETPVLATCGQTKATYLVLPGYPRSPILIIVGTLCILS